MTKDFWKSAGMHLVERNADGWLTVTPDYLRAYLTRPEVHPVEESNGHEIALHEALLADPFRAVSDAEIATIEDADAIETYRIVLTFRDLLVRAGSIEGAYLQLMRSQKPVHLPPVFLDQMVHLILRNVLRDVRDPIRLRAAELFFRDQTVSTEGGRLMLADDEIVEMQSQSAGTGLAQLLNETGTPMKQVDLDVLDEDNASIYWQRSDRFDTVATEYMRHGEALGAPGGELGARGAKREAIRRAVGERGEHDVDRSWHSAGERRGRILATA